METWNISQSKIRKLVAEVLRNVPSHTDTPKNPTDLINHLKREDDFSDEIKLSIIYTVVSIIDIFGILEWNGEFCRYKGEIPENFRNSLIWFLSNNQEIFSNWRRLGASREIKISNLLEMAPYFLRILEEKRLRLIDQKNFAVGTTRELAVAVLLIKKVHQNKPYFLFQWDQYSEGYQLIGGKIRGNESSFVAAQREMQEEISQHDLIYDRDYELQLLSEKPIETIDISRTEGALTHYKFWVYFVKFTIPTIRLSNVDQWITVDELLQGHTKTGREIAYVKSIRLIDANIENSLNELPSSFGNIPVPFFNRISWRIVLRVISIFFCIFSIIWLITSPGFEPFLTLLSGIVAFIGSYFDLDKI